MKRAAAIFVAVAMTASLIAGCSATSSRPSLNDAVARYDEMLAAMRDDISGVVGVSDWVEATEASTTPGDHAYGEGAELAHSPQWNLPDVRYSELNPSERDSLISGLSDIATDYGFTRFSLYTDTDDALSAVTGDSIRTEVQFGASTSVTLSYNTQSLVPTG